MGKGLLATLKKANGCDPGRKRCDKFPLLATTDVHPWILHNYDEQRESTLQESLLTALFST